MSGRWEAFLAKVASRADEVLAEADAGLDAIIATEVLDPVPLSSALSELHARMLGLERKIDASWEKIEAELDAAEDRDALHAAGRRLQKDLNRRSKVLQVQKQANAARALWALAEAEMKTLAQSARCSQCGAPVTPTLLHQASNVTCSHCKSVSVIRPGAATAMFFQGIALHAFGEEAALEESVRLDAADEKYKSLRRKRRSDVEAWVAAHRRYWLVYAKGYGRCVPDWSEAKSGAMAEAKLGGLKLELDSVETVD